MSRGRNKDLAAVDGRRFSMDGIMTALAVVLLLIVVVIPVVSIIYNAFFFQGHFDPELFTSSSTAATWLPCGTPSRSPSG
jgi:iron(III) transport system permease protein